MRTKPHAAQLQNYNTKVSAALRIRRKTRILSLAAFGFLACSIAAMGAQTQGGIVSEVVVCDFARSVTSARAGLPEVRLMSAARRSDQLRLPPHTFLLHEMPPGKD